jgi:hypothetical protein
MRPARRSKRFSPLASTTIVPPGNRQTVEIFFSATAGRLVGARHFRLAAGEQSQATYQWTPPGRHEPTIDFHFCKRCGIRTPGRGDMEHLGGTFYAVQVNLLQEVDADELAAAPIRHIDGRHDRWDEAPADTRCL